MRRWLAAAALMTACTGGPQVEASAPDVEGEALARAEALRARVQRELDCSGDDAPLLCALTHLGEGSRPSWPSGPRRAMPAVLFGVRPSRPLVHGALQTADVVMGVMGDGGVTLLGLEAPDDSVREQIIALRRGLALALLPGEQGRGALQEAMALPGALLDASALDGFVLGAVRPGKRAWLGEEGVWFALPPEAAPARWVRLEVHGEGTRLVMLLSSDAAGAR